MKDISSIGNKIWKLIIQLSVLLFTLYKQVVLPNGLGPIYTGSMMNPTFTDIYAPLEGRTINGGVKVNL